MIFKEKIMSKNKIAKLLLALGIGVVTAASSVAIAGCNNTTDGTDTGGGGGGGQQQEQPITEYTVKFDLNGLNGQAPDDQKVKSGDKLSPVEISVPDGYILDGWFDAKTDGNKWNFETDTVTGNITLYAHWHEILTLATPAPKIEDGVLSWDAVTGADEYEIYEGGELIATQAETEYTIDNADRAYGVYTFSVKAISHDHDAYFDGDVSATVYYIYTDSDFEYEEVTTTVDLQALQDYFGTSNKLEEPYTEGAVTFDAGVYFDTSSSVPSVNNQQKKITFNLQGVYNSIKFDAKGASSGTLNLYKKDGTVLKEYGTISSAVTGLTADYLPAGEYYLQSAGSLRLSKISYTQYLEKGTPVAMEVKASNVDFLIGREFSAAGVNATVEYDNGAKRAVNLTAANFDYSDVNMDEVGEYTVRISYTENGETIHGEYTVYVYAVTSIELATSTTNGNKQTNFNLVYKQGGTFSEEGLTVVATATCQTKTKEFVLNASDYTTNKDAINLSATGEQTYTVTVVSEKTAGGAAITKNITINVVAAIQAENNQVTVGVDKSQPVSATNFHTITDALCYLKQLNLGAGVVKVINIADGEYFEKVFVDIPNVQLIGSDTNTPDHATDNGVVIVYDAIAGGTDASGHTYGTNGSATVTVTTNASNFIARNITFKNYYNTYELYSQSLQISSDSQAVALLVESPSAAFYGCKLTSYHDTLYSNKGNHYYEKCWIEGHTDYIFGQDAIAYFNDCDIYSIGAGASVSNGGYVTALKPTDSGNTKYYFVYNNCRFDADENTMKGSVALGRAWGAGMKMVVINSTISEKFSTAAHTATTTNGQRYCTMSGNEPKPGNMLEYGNTGAGAIEASIANTCTYMTETEAAAYDLDNLSTILGWNPRA